jgi:ketosteroid isomerase-like protein
MYERFNARDIDGVLVSLHEDVEWANGMDGGHVRGKADVRDYWTRQRSEVSARVEPISFNRRGDGVVEVEVRQTLYDPSGLPLASQGGLHSRVVRHVYRFDGGKVARFDIDTRD